MKPHPSSNMSAACKLVMHRDSHVISKIKPKIHIIHIVAPKIIQTDVANFRELVQRLTGKPADSRSQIEKTSSAPIKELWTFCTEPSKNTESENGMHILQNRDRMRKESHEIWGGENSTGFTGGFGDLDGLIQDLTEFPLLPLSY